MYAGVFTDVKEFNKYQLVRKCMHATTKGISVTNVKPLELIMLILAINVYNFRKGNLNVFIIKSISIPKYLISTQLSWLN